MTPYASVIIPTHDRAATLPMTVESVRRQSVRDLEIVISGDGVTAEVREIANALAGADDRVRFLDLPKTTGRGGINRDVAVRAAQAERIFYTDDDDLWLADHVATLGPLLDEADIADSLVASVGSSGTLHVCFIDSSCPGNRQSFADGRGKTVFDTHLAHRKSAYLRVAGSWAHDSPGVLFASFARDREIRWRSIGAVTAISLHGAPRAALTAAERRTEILRWFSRLGELEQRGMPSLAASAYWAFLVTSIRGLIDPPPASFVRLSDVQRSHFRTAALLAAGLPTGEAHWQPLLSQLLDPVIKDTDYELLADRLSGGLGAVLALAKLREFADEEPTFAGQAGLVSAFILFGSGREGAEVEAALAPAFGDWPRQRAEALMLLARLRAPHSIEAAADLAEAAVTAAPRMERAWSAQFEHALHAGRMAAARCAIERLDALWSEKPQPRRAKRVARMERSLQRHLKRVDKAAAREAKLAAREFKARR
jgi:hypothetical protein